MAAFDGLRAVALLAILLFRQGFDLARGGFLGLSSFFTLSGFLVTSIVLAERAQDGRLWVGRFYEHRARRILPPLFLTVAAVVALQVTLATSVPGRTTGATSSPRSGRSSTGATCSTAPASPGC